LERLSLAAGDAAQKSRCCLEKRPPLRFNANTAKGQRRKEGTIGLPSPLCDLCCLCLFAFEKWGGHPLFFLGITHASALRPVSGSIFVMVSESFSRESAIE
jgi:hypothetical protein